MSGLSPSLLSLPARRPASPTARFASFSAALAVTLAFTGCAGLENIDLGSVLGASSTPTADIVGLSLSDLSAHGLKLLADVRVDNPLAAALPLINLDYDITSGGKSFLDGSAALDGSVPAGGSKTVQLPLGIAFSDLLDVLSGVKPGAIVPYEANLTMNVDAPLLGPLSLPLSTTGELPVPTVPNVTLDSVDWSDLSFTNIAGTLNFGVENTNDFPIDIDNLSYGLNLAGVDVSQGKVTSAPSLTKGDKKSIQIPIQLSPAKLGSAAMAFLTGDGADYAMSGSLDLSTPFGPVSLPFADIGKTVFGK